MMNQHTAAYVVFFGTLISWAAIPAAWVIWGADAALLVGVAVIASRLSAKAAPIMRGG